MKSAPRRDEAGSRAETASTASTSTRSTTSSRHIQGGTHGSGRPLGLGAVDYEACNDTKKDFARKPIIALPGYGGYQPGVESGNVHGETYVRTNKAGLEHLRTYRAGKIPKHQTPSRWYSEYGTYNVGTEIPGYTGHVPGLRSGNMVGMCTPRSAKAHWRPQGGYGRGDFEEPLIVGNVSNKVHP